MRLATLFLSLVLVSQAWATSCPDKIRYTSGAYLKNGDRYYYPNGAYAIRSADRLYYPGGSYLKNGDRVYYPTGSYLQNGDRLYYPSGSYLKNGDRYYYSNGGYFKRGDTFYHESGSYARRNGKLYREDGSKTVFPLELSSKVGTYGRLWAQVSATEEALNLAFNHSLVDESQAKVRARWNGVVFGDFSFRFNTGNTGENVHVNVDAGQIDCQLLPGGGGNGTTFTVRGAAGQARVKLRAGHDGQAIRQAIKKVLDQF